MNHDHDYIIVIKPVSLFVMRCCLLLTASTNMVSAFAAEVSCEYGNVWLFHVTGKIHIT